MALHPSVATDVYSIYSYPDNQEPDGIGAMPAITLDTMVLKGTVNGRITSADTLEPDVRSPFKDGDVDESSMAIGFTNIPVGFSIQAGDYIVDNASTDQFFAIEHVDREPGGLKNHHYELRLITTEITRNIGLV
jgi:hypothetical protein